MHEKQKRYQRKKASEGAEIGEIPAVVNPERREACRLDLERYLTTYFPATTGKNPLSDDHKRMIARIQRCTLEGGLFLNAFPRGFGKTTIGENATLWATKYGHRNFFPVFGANAAAAKGNIDSIQMELAENDLLFEDFPEVCFPIRCLEGKPQRCASQTHGGQPTHIEWTSGRIVLPTIEGSAASGAVIMARGLTAAARGLKFKRPDGTQQRPNFFLIDDPQTDQAASSPLQISKLLNVIRKSVLKLGGHDRKIAGVMNATVIRSGDLVEQMLDRSKFPAWQGERIKMVKSWAKAHETLWLEEYRKLRNTFDASDPDDQQRAHKRATEFYRKNRAKMDAGCAVSWEHCFDPETEISAIQHAYNCLIDDGEEVFASECQNEPLVEKIDDDELTLRADDVARKTNGMARGAIPIQASHLVAMVDPKKDLLYWVLAAVADGFSGWVIDYGTFPDQKQPYFSSRKLRYTLGKVTKADSWEAALYAGLTTLVGELAGREYKRDDGSVIRLGRCLIDHAWGDAKETVDLFCRQSPHAAILRPSRGVYCGATSRPFSDYRPKPGDRVGTGWRIPAGGGRHAVREIQFDANHYKAFTISRLKTPQGGRGCLSLYGDSPERHALFADHAVSEKPFAVEAKGRRVIEFKQLPGQDNDYLDCLVGCQVAASELGVSLHDRQPVVRKKVKLSDLQKKSRHWDSAAKKWVTKNA